MAGAEISQNNYAVLSRKAVLYIIKDNHSSISSFLFSQNGMTIRYQFILVVVINVLKEALNCAYAIPTQIENGEQCDG